MSLGAGGEGRDLLMPHMKPLNFLLPAYGIGEPVQAVADNAVKWVSLSLM